MATFVLVHGAFGSTLSWRWLAPLLQSAGHEVYAPTLSGLAERIHVGGPHTNLSTHAQDIGGLIEALDLRGILLVGHSYGGMVITCVADRMPQRIAHLVYLDALLPRDGESCWDMDSQGELAANAVEDGWLMLFPQRPGLPSPPSRGHPLGTLQEKVRLSRPLEEQAFSRTYVKAGGAPPPAAEQRTGNFWNAAERVRFDPAWSYHELAGNHGIHREMPHAVAGLLLHLAAQTASTPPQ